MRFDPKTDEELEAELLLDDGRYDAEVIESEEKQDKKGNDMLALKLKLWANDGSTRHVYDYISPHWFHHKFKNFCIHAGLGNEYEAGAISGELALGKSVVVLITTQKQEGYPPKNTVVDYLDPTNPTQSSKQEPPPIDDDDLPF